MNKMKTIIIALTTVFTSYTYASYQNYATTPSRIEAVKDFFKKTKIFFKAIKNGGYSDIKVVEYGDYIENQATYNSKKNLAIVIPDNLEDANEGTITISPLARNIKAVSIPKGFIITPELLKNVDKEKFITFLPESFVLSSGSDQITVLNCEKFISDVLNNTVTISNYQLNGKKVQTGGGSSTGGDFLDIYYSKQTTSTTSNQDFEKKFKEAVSAIFGPNVSASNLASSTIEDIEDYESNHQITPTKALEDTYYSAKQLIKVLGHSSNILPLDYEDYNKNQLKYNKEKKKKILVIIPSNTLSASSLGRNVNALAIPEDFVLTPTITSNVKKQEFTTVLPNSFILSDGVKQIIVLSRERFISDVLNNTVTTSNYQLNGKKIQTGSSSTGGKSFLDIYYSKQTTSTTSNQAFEQKFKEAVTAIFGENVTENNFASSIEEYIANNEERGENIFKKGAKKGWNLIKGIRAKRQNKKKERTDDEEKISRSKVDLATQVKNEMNTSRLEEPKYSVKTVNYREYRDNQEAYDKLEGISVKVPSDIRQIKPLGENVVKLTIPEGFTFTTKTIAACPNVEIEYPKSIKLSASNTGSNPITVLDVTVLQDDIDNKKCTLENYRQGNKKIEKSNAEQFKKQLFETYAKIFPMSEEDENDRSEFIAEKSRIDRDQDKKLQEQALEIEKLKAELEDLKEKYNLLLEQRQKGRRKRN